MCKSLVLTQEELRDFRICWSDAIRHCAPYTFAMSREIYNEHYHRKFKHLIPYDYVGIIEKHSDWYVHSTTRENAEAILYDGVLQPGRSNECCSVGKAVYTYPLGAGRVAKKDPFVTIVFQANGEHIHLIDSIDSNSVLGEANFLSDIAISKATVYSSMEIDKLLEEHWRDKSALPVYYGVKKQELASIDYSIDREYLSRFLNDFVIDYDGTVLQKVQSF